MTFTHCIIRQIGYPLKLLAISKCAFEEKKKEILMIFTHCIIQQVGLLKWMKHQDFLA